MDKNPSNPNSILHVSDALKYICSSKFSIVDNKKKKQKLNLKHSQYQN